MIKKKNSSNKIISDKEFELTLQNVKPNFYEIDCGKYRDEEVAVSFKIKLIEKGFLLFKIRFTKHPHINPFCVIIHVQIGDQIERFFYEKKSNEYRPLNFYHTKFQKQSIVKEKVAIRFKLHQISLFICTLNNSHTLCYLNSATQLLAHLNQFRKFICSISKCDEARSTPIPYYLNRMKDLFNQMERNNEKLSTVILARSFGWSQIALQIQCDASEFLYTLLSHISQNTNPEKLKKFDSIFASHFIVRKIQKTKSIENIGINSNIDEQNQSDHNDNNDNQNNNANTTNENNSLNLITRNSNQSNTGTPNEGDDNTYKEIEIMLQTYRYANGSIYTIIENYLANDLFVKRFEKFPEVLLLQVKGRYEQFEDKIDLSKFSINPDSQNIQHSKYTLSGFIVHVGSFSNSGHYKCVVRSNYEDIWYYFNDSVSGLYSCFEYESNIQKCLHSIAKKANETECIRVLMYVADDVLHHYFDPNERFMPISKGQFQEVKNDQSENITFYIMTNEDVVDHIEKGHVDFKEVGFTFSFEAKATVKKSEVYEKVAKYFGVDETTFVLRATDMNAPTIDVFLNTPTIIPRPKSSYRLFYEIIDYETDPTKQLTIPYFFLYYKFDPKKFLLNLENNLNHSHISKSDKRPIAPKSVDPRRLKVRRKLIPGFLKTKFQKEEEEEKSDSDEDNTQKVEKLIERNDFTYIKTIVLTPYDKLKDVKTAILEKLNKSDNATVCFYATDENAQIIEIDQTQEIKKFLSGQTSKYIYVQTFENEGSSNNLKLNSDQISIEKIMNMKFLFLRYMERALCRPVNPFKLSNVFMIENLSIPVTFCKLDDPAVSKTMLFPVVCPFSLSELNKIICAAMDDRYEKSSFMQIFLSFRKDSPPFIEKVDSIEKLRRALEYALFKSEISVYKVHFSLSSSSLENIHYDTESDTDFKSNFFIHYKKFDSKKNDQISLRFYFSEDAINTKMTSQALVKEGSKISDITQNFLNVFPIEKFNEDDRHEIEKIMRNEKKFTDVFRIMKITNCKIANTVKVNFSLFSTIAIRFERIQNNHTQIVGYLPCYFGARFNKTNLIVPFGSPFLFPVAKGRVDAYKKDIEHCLIKEDIVAALKGIKKDEVELFVTEFQGIILQDKKVNEIEKIIAPCEVVEMNSEIKTYVAVCFSNMNGASFLDEKKYFNGDIKILY